MLAAPPAAGTAVRPVDVVGEYPNDFIQRRYQEFMQEVGVDLSTCVPLTDEELDGLVYQDYLEDRAKKAMRY